MNEVQEPVPPPSSSVPDKVKKSILRGFSEETHKGNYVERKWMDAYSRVAGALPEGKRKQAMEFVRPVAVTVANANKVGAGIVDFALRSAGSMALGIGVLCVSNPLEVVQWGRAMEIALTQMKANPPKEMEKIMEKMGFKTPEGMGTAAVDAGDIIPKPRTYWDVAPKEVMQKGMVLSLQGAVMGTAGRVSGVQFMSGALADILGMGGERVAQIQNFILGKLTAPNATPAEG